MTCNDYVYFARDGNSLVVMVTQHIYVMYIKAYSKKLHYVPGPVLQDTVWLLLLQVNVPQPVVGGLVYLPNF